MTTRSAWRWLRPAVVILLAAVVIGVPLWLVLATSAKPQGEAVRPNLDPPRQWQPAGNYADAYQEGEILRGLVNSLLVIVPSVVLVLLLGAAAAWVFARRKGRLVAAAYAVSLSGLLLPPAIITIVLLLRQRDHPQQGVRDAPAGREDDGKRPGRLRLQDRGHAGKAIGIGNARAAELVDDPRWVHAHELGSQAKKAVRLYWRALMHATGARPFRALRHPSRLRKRRAARVSAATRSAR